MIISPIKTDKNNTRIKAVELKNISKRYNLVKGIDPEFRDFWALKDAHLDVYQGQITGIIGRNGAGKTTLLNIIAGIVTPTGGEISVKGRVFGLFNLSVGFQDELTGRENIFLNGAIIGAAKKELSAKLDSIIEFSELGNFIDMPLGSYSQGMRLRLGFSIIANLDFDILVIDEILGVGDSLFQNKCYERLMDFKRCGKTLIITTQSMALIERFCDRAVLLDHGSIVFHGEPVDTINKYHALLNTEKFFVGPAHEEQNLIKNTKKWVDDKSDLGKKLGTKEVVIDSVEFINKFGWRTHKIKTRDPLKIKVNFTVKNFVKEPHFGVAIFREDGVYCYGPNTKFDGYRISELTQGKGYFIINYRSLLLAPGEYSISVAIWDKNETLAYDYHNGCYKLIIESYNNNKNELLNMLFKTNGIDNGFIKLNDITVKTFNACNEEKNVFITNQPVRFDIYFNRHKDMGKVSYICFAIDRDDGVRCQSIVLPIRKNSAVSIHFPKLCLLPGGYNISAGIYNDLREKFLMQSNNIYPFCMVFNKRDYGTAYLEHNWYWG